MKRNERAFGATTMCLLLLACSSGPGAASASAAASAQVFRGAARTGVYPAPEGSAYGGYAWKFQTGGTVRSSPVVSGDTLYEGSGDHYLYALDAATGDLRWKFDAGAPVTSSPAIANGRVYFQSHVGTTFALDAATGAPVWQMKSGAAMPLHWGYESGDFYSSSPAIAGGAVIIGSGDGNVYAYDAADGHVRWQTPTGGRVRGSPAIAGNVAYVGSFDGKLYALDVATGAVKWTFSTLGTTLESGKFGYDRRSVQSSPAVGNGAVYVGARDGLLYAVDAESGKQRWSYDHKISWVNTTPGFDGTNVYAGSSDKQYLQAVDAATGAQQWRTPDGALSLVWSSPAIAGGVVYAGDWAGQVDAFDKATGHLNWTARMGWKRVLSSPAIAGQRLYYGSDDGAIYAVNLVKGPGLARAVFVDPAYAKANTIAAPDAVATYFAHRGYAQLDAAKLAAFLNARIANRAPSVVVFAQSVLPDAQLIGRYLHAGGKVVWVGEPPLIMPHDLKTGDADILAIEPGRAVAARYLGVTFRKSNFDPTDAHPTQAGTRWGIEATGYAPWPADPESVTTVLSTDEDGLAAAWVKNYGGPEGTGFVRIPLNELAGGAPDNLASVQFAAEYAPNR